MKLFDTYVEQAAALLRPALGSEIASPEGAGVPQTGAGVSPDCAGIRQTGAGISPEGAGSLPGSAGISPDGPLWPMADRNPFIMERDTAAELGGYPKESINLILATLADLPVEGLHLIGGTHLSAGHQSFGKVVFLQTEEIPEEEIYDFQQKVQLADLRLQLRDVMVRSSSRQYLLNLRVGKKAIADGFDLEILGRTIHEHFRGVPRVKDAAVILVSGDSPLYRQLMPAAERVREITAALNTMFEGIEMDCGSCSMSPICDEVEDLRRLHKKKAKG